MMETNPGDSSMATVEDLLGAAEDANGLNMKGGFSRPSPLFSGLFCTYAWPIQCLCMAYE